MIPKYITESQRIVRLQQKTLGKSVQDQAYQNFLGLESVIMDIDSDKFGNFVG